MKRISTPVFGAALLATLALTVPTNNSFALAQSAPTVIQLTNSDQFAPKTVTINVGTTVHWDNVSTMVHTVTDVPKLAAYPGDAVLPSGAAPFNSGYIKPGGSFEHTFTTPGTYKYFCIPHEPLGMVASIVVVPAGESTSSMGGTSESSAMTVPRQPINASLFPTPVFVTLQRSNEVEEFPEQTIWHGYDQSHFDAVSPHGNRIVVSGFQDGNVYIGDAHDGRILATLHVGGLIQGVKVDPNGKYALAVDAKDGAVAVIDMRALKIVSIIPVGKTPHNVVYRHDGNIAYVTLQGQQAVALVDMRTLKKVGELQLPGINGPHNEDVSEDGRTLWVRSHATPDTMGEVARVDLATGRVEGPYTQVGDYHGGMTVRPATGYAYTTDIGGNTADVLDARTQAIVKRIVVGAGPHGIRLSPDGRYVYVSVTRTNQLVVLDAHTFKILESIRTRGDDPFWLAVEGND